MINAVIKMARRLGFMIKFIGRKIAKVSNAKKSITANGW